MDALQAAYGFELVRFNPERIRRFAQAKRRMAKHDRADALTIAQATAILPEIAAEPRRRDLDPLVRHLTYRRQVRDWIDHCRNQIEHLKDKQLRKMMQQRAGFERELQAIDQKLAELVDQHEVAGTRRAPAHCPRRRAGAGIHPDCAARHRQPGRAGTLRPGQRHPGERQIKDGRAAVPEVH